MPRLTLLSALLITGFMVTQTTAADRAPGLTACFYELDRSVPALPGLAAGEKPNVVRTIGPVNLGDDGESFAPMTDNFLSDVRGFIQIAKAGDYAFRLLSDDGGQLYIDDQLVIDYDGLHGADPKDATTKLTAGEHTLRLRHFEATGGERLALLWQTPGAGEFVYVPADVLSHDPSDRPATAPGKKHVIPPLRRGLPGDNSPIEGVHPTFALQPVDMAAETLPESTVRAVKLRTTLAGIPGGNEIWLYPEIGRPGTITSVLVPTAAEGQPGQAYAGQLLAARTGSDAIERVHVETIEGVTQGAAFRCMGKLPNAIGYLSDGDDAAKCWCVSTSADGAKVTTQIVPQDATAFEVLSAKAYANGLELTFTEPLDPRVGWDPESYYVEMWPFDEQTAPRRDGTPAKVTGVSVSADRTHVFVEIADLAASNVVYLRLLPPCINDKQERPWSTEVWYTMNVLPERRWTEMRPRPQAEPQNLLTADEKAAGWELLFDGRTTNGWHAYAGEGFPDGWQVIDGCLVRVGPAGDISTDQEFDNFELQYDWRISAGGNSGLMWRVEESKTAPWATGQEMQVLDDAEHPDGRNPLTSAGADYALYPAPRGATEPVGLFNHARIVARGPEIEYWLNGKQTAKFTINSPDWKRRVAESKFKDLPHFGQFPRGHIVLQDHGDRVWYRNIKIRPLDAVRP